MTGLWLLTAAAIIAALAFTAGRAWERTNAPDTEHLLDELDHATDVIARQQARIRTLRHQLDHATTARPR